MAVDIGIILAGGQSRRMGCDKAALVYQGETLLEKSSLLLQQLACNTILTSRNTGEGIKDIFEKSGPLAGLHAALSKMHNVVGKTVVVVPIDMPLLRYPHLQLLVEKSIHHGSPAYYEEHYLPFVMTINENTMQHLVDQLNDGDRSVKSFLALEGATAIPNVYRNYLINTNTPEDWSKVNNFNS